MIGVLVLCHLPHIAHENHRGCYVAVLCSSSGGLANHRAKLHLLSVSQSLGRALANKVRNVVVCLVYQSLSSVDCLPAYDYVVVLVLAVQADCNL